MRYTTRMESAGFARELTCYNQRSARRSLLGVCPGHEHPRLYDRLTSAFRARHYSRRTQDSYCQWIERFIFFHHPRHPAEMAERGNRKELSGRTYDGPTAYGRQSVFARRFRQKRTVSLHRDIQSVQSLLATLKCPEMKKRYER